MYPHVFLLLSVFLCAPNASSHPTGQQYSVSKGSISQDNGKERLNSRGGHPNDELQHSQELKVSFNAKNVNIQNLCIDVKQANSNKIEPIYLSKRKMLDIPIASLKTFEIDELIRNVKPIIEEYIKNKDYLILLKWIMRRFLLKAMEKSEIDIIVTVLKHFFNEDDRKNNDKMTSLQNLIIEIYMNLQQFINNKMSEIYKNINGTTSTKRKIGQILVNEKDSEETRNTDQGLQNNKKIRLIGREKYSQFQKNESTMSSNSPLSHQNVHYLNSGTPSQLNQPIKVEDQVNPSTSLHKQLMHGNFTAESQVIKRADQIQTDYLLDLTSGSQ